MYRSKKNGEIYYTIRYNFINVSHDGIIVVENPADGTYENGYVNYVQNWWTSPAFDNDEFSKGITNEKWNQLLIDKSNPLLNRCISGLYSPG